MKKQIAAVGILCLSLAMFSGCALYGNDRSGVSRMAVQEREEGLVFTLPTCTLTYCEADGSLLCSEEWEWVDLPSFEAYGNSFDKYYCMEYGEGYEGLQTHIESLAAEHGRRYYTFNLLQTDEKAYGCAVFYTSPVGYLSGGGNIAAEKVDCSVYFSYDKESGAFQELGTHRGEVALVFDGTYELFWRDEAIFSRRTGSEEEKFIYEDVAFDKGMTHYSYAGFFIGGGYFMIRFSCGFSDYTKDYELYVLAKTNGEVLAETKVSKWT